MAKRTIIVSPDPGLVRQTRGVLEARGVMVRSAVSAQEALDAAQSGELDLVISEVDLPGGSGYDLCRSLKATRGGPEPKVILLYTAGEGSVERNAVECGADGCLRRPFLTSQFLEALVPVVGPTFFALDMGDSSVPPEDRNPASLVGAGTGVFSEGVAPLDSQALDPDGGGDLGAGTGGPRTQELPPLNVEPFDEDNPVSVPVGAFATAHGLAVVSQASESVQVSIEGDSLDDSLDDSLSDSSGDVEPVPAPFATDQISALGRRTAEGAGGDPDALQDAARIRRAVDAHLDELLEPGGRLAELLEGAVDRAVAKALAQAIPAATEAAARLLRADDD